MRFGKTSQFNTNVAGQCAIVMFNRRMNSSNHEPGFSSSPLDDSDGSELHGLLADAGHVARVHHVGHVLVALRGLLHHQLRRGHADRDTLLLQLVQNLGKYVLLSIPEIKGD